MHRIHSHTHKHIQTHRSEKKLSSWTKANRNDFDMLGLIREPYIFTQIVGLNYSQGKEERAIQID